MTRSKKGLEGAGEWHELKKLLPDFTGKKSLILAVAMVGIVVMQWNRVRKKSLALIYLSE